MGHGLRLPLYVCARRSEGELCRAIRRLQTGLSVIRAGVRSQYTGYNFYTAFGAARWMFCVCAHEERAAFRLNLVAPDEFQAAANLFVPEGYQWVNLQRATRRQVAGRQRDGLDGCDRA